VGDPENDLRRNLATGQFDRMQRIEVALLAKEMGLNPAEYSQPFPGNSTITINNHGQAGAGATKPVGAGLGKIAAAGLIAGGLGAGRVGLGLPWLASILLPKATEKVIEKVITKPGSSYDVQVDMQVIPPGK